MDEDEACTPPDLVRSFALTGGRTHAHAALDVATQVVATNTGYTTACSMVQLEILDCCQRALSVAEIAHAIDRPLSVTKVLLTDLLEQRLIDVGPYAIRDGYPDRALLQSVLDGLRAL